MDLLLNRSEMPVVGDQHPLGHIALAADLKIETQMRILIYNAEVVILKLSAGLGIHGQNILPSVFQILKINLPAGSRQREIDAAEYCAFPRPALTDDSKDLPGKNLEMNIRTGDDGTTG
jgi:hypothetical protein